MAKLQNLETLTLSGCGYRPEDLSHLRGWRNSLDIEVDDDVETIRGNVRD